MKKRICSALDWICWALDWIPPPIECIRDRKRYISGYGCRLGISRWVSDLCDRWGVRLEPKPVTLPRLVYARLMHLAYAGANLLAEPNGQTDVEPYPVNKAWLDQIDKEAR